MHNLRLMLNQNEIDKNGVKVTLIFCNGYIFRLFLRWLRPLRSTTRANVETQTL